jgi:hypothetical protein
MTSLRKVEKMIEPQKMIFIEERRCDYDIMPFRREVDML